MPISLLVACREKHLALLLCGQIPPPPGDTLIAEPIATDSLLRNIRGLAPDVLLLEHSAGGEGTTLELLRQLQRTRPRPRVLLACDAYTQPMIVSFIRQGARGCLLRTSEPSLYAKAIAAVHRGEAWFGRTALLEALRSQMAAGSEAVGVVETGEQQPLTGREQEILKLIGNAMSNKEIARQLKISDQTVKTHLHHIYVKLQTSGRYKVFLSNSAAGSRDELGATGRVH